MKNRIIYYDILKVIAICAVIIIHVIGNTINTFGLSGKPQIIYNTICHLCYFAVPLFVMISGAIFLNPEKENTIKDMLYKYVFKIFLCLLIFGFIYSVMEIYFTIRRINLQLIINSFKNIITGNLWAHMWYLYLILGLYLLTPIFKIISKNITKNEYKFFLLLLFLFTMVIPDISNYLKINIAFNILILNPYILFYFLGDFLSRYDISKKLKICIYILGICSIITIILNNVIPQIKLNHFSYTCTIMFNIIVSIFIFFKNKTYDKSKKIYRITCKISENALGIYLIHQLFINIIYKFLKINVILKYPYIFLIIYSLLILGISYLTTCLLKKVKLIKKYIL